MKKRILSLIFCVAILVSYTIVSPFAVSAAQELLVNESFNQYATNDIPSDLTISSNTHFIKEYIPGNKGIFISAERNVSALTYTFDATDKLVISFEVMTTTNNIKGALRLNMGGKTFDVLKYTTMNAVTTHNGQQIGGYSTSHMNRYDVCIDVTKNFYDVYLNGKQEIVNYRIFKTALGSLTGFSFVTEVTDEENCAIIYDNINAHIGTKPLESYPESAFNTDEYPPVEVKTKAEIGVNRILNADFEEAMSVKIYDRQNVMERYEDENGNHVLMVERLNGSDFQMDANGVGGMSDYVVYDFDLKLINPFTRFSVLLKDNNSNFATFAMTIDGIITMGNFSVSVADGKWHNIAAVYNYFDRVRDVYFDGELVLKGESIGNTIGGAHDVNVFRITCTKCDDPGEKPAKFMVDNVRIYENEVPVDDISQLKRTIVIDKNKTRFESDTSRKEMLKGYTAVHARGAMVYTNEEKTKLTNQPYQNTNGGWMLPVSELSELLGYTYSVADGKAVINDQTLALGKYEVKDSIIYVDADYYFEDIAGKCVWHNNISQNDGLIIAGDTVFTPPEDPEMLQKLNNFIFYERPSQEKIISDYNVSPLKAQHPRIQATADDFEHIKELVKTDAYMQMWYEYIIGKADILVSDSVALKYELRDGVRLLYVSRDALKNMYTLGMAYQLTGEQKYADRAWIDLEAVSKFPDWHPEHDIDLGEMCAAVAIGYDWLYSGLSEEQHAVIEEGIYQNGFYDAVNSYQSVLGKMGGVETHTNHNIVVNGGIAMAGLAFMDVYPEISGYVVSGAIRGADWMIYRYAPAGAWYEGPHYWEYATQYTTKMLSSLETILGTAYNLDKTQGLSTASQYVLNMQSELGIFNYGDGLQSNIYVPEMFWLSNKYDDVLSTAVPMVFSRGKFSDAEDYALALLFYDPDKNNSAILSSLPLDAYYKGEDVMAFRDKWSSEATTFVGIKAGYTSESNGVINWHSQLDGGSFIFDSTGVRWAKELGMSPYDLPGAGDYSEFGTHWDLFRARAEAHNTIIINPDDGPDHATRSCVNVMRYETKPRGGIAVLDMSDVLRNNASAAKRAIMLTDDRQSLVVRDEITLRQNDSDVYWFMQTDADVEIVENGAILRQLGSVMKLEFISNTAAEISVGDSVPLPTSPVVEKDSIGGANRICIKMPKASGDVSITVKLTPDNLWNPSTVTDYNIPIDIWNIPDGEIMHKPTLDLLTIDDRKIELTESTVINFVCVESEYTTIPEIVAVAPGYSVEVIKGATLEEGARIMVSDGERATIYKVNFRTVPAPMQFEGSTSVPVVAVTVSDEPQPENGAFNVIDGDLKTRWSALGVEQWIKLELKEQSVIDKLAIAFASGDVRSTKIQIMVSNDDMNYEEIFDGWSCGTTLEHEFFDIGGKNIKYIKIGCDGNTAQGIGGWNSITEIVAMKNN